MSTTRQAQTAVAEGRRVRDRIARDLDSDKFILHSQATMPLIARENEASYREILIRFKDEETNLQSPGMFLPLLEEQGLMPLLDRWVVSHVLKWLGDNARMQVRGVHVCSINLAPDTIGHGAFAEHVEEELRRTGIRGASLSFEIPVGEALADPSFLQPLMFALRDVGCTFALSGFNGTAQEFELASQLGFTIVKLDGALVYGLTEDDRRLGLLDGINRRCHRVGIRTVGMQVESQEALQALRAIQIDYAQGFGVERPRLLEFA